MPSTPGYIPVSESALACTEFEETEAPSHSTWVSGVACLCLGVGFILTIQQVRDLTLLVSHWEKLVGLLPVWMIFQALLFLGLSFMALVGGAGLWQRRRWGWMLVCTVLTIDLFRRLLGLFSFTQRLFMYMAMNEKNGSATEVFLLASFYLLCLGVEAWILFRLRRPEYQRECGVGWR